MLTDYIFTSDITQSQSKQLYKAFNRYFVKHSGDGLRHNEPEKNIILAIDKAAKDDLLSWSWYDTKTLLNLKHIAVNILQGE